MKAIQILDIPSRVVAMKVELAAMAEGLIGGICAWFVRCVWDKTGRHWKVSEGSLYELLMELKS
jgi:hypothetical protein